MLQLGIEGMQRNRDYFCMDIAVYMQYVYLSSISVGSSQSAGSVVLDYTDIVEYSLASAVAVLDCIDKVVYDLAVVA